VTITIEWDNDARTAIRFDIGRGDDWDSFEAAIAKGHAMMAGVPHTVDVIIDTEDGASPPPGAIPRFRRVQEDGPANRGLTTIVGAGLFPRLLVSTFNRIYKNRDEEVLFANTLAEARLVLARKRADCSSR
jgi:hypothetical protein